MDYSKQISIDKDDLDGELVRQPSLYLGASEDYVRKVSERDRLKEMVDKTRAKIELRIRREASKSGDKMTESQIKAKAEIDEDFRAAVDQFLDAKEEADMALAIKDAFSQRAFILKDLCALYIAGYYSESSVSGGDSRKTMEDGYLRRREEMASARKRRRL